MKNFLRQKGETADLVAQENREFEDSKFIDVEMLECALTVVISNAIVKPRIEIKNGFISIHYKLQKMNVKIVRLMNDISRLNRLDIWVDAIQMSVKAKFHNMIGDYSETSTN